MKAKNASEAKRLEDIPNIGKSIAEDFRRLGIHEPRQLLGKNPYTLYSQMNEISGVTQDPCLADCFIAAVRFMEGSEPTPWWHYTEERKQALCKKGKH